MANNPYVNKVVYDGTTLIDITDTTATESDVAQGVVFYKADGTRSIGTMAGVASFVGMVVQGTNLTTEADVKAIYGSNTSWTLLSSVALGSEHIFGNGYTTAMTDGTNLGALRSRGDNAAPTLYGQPVGYGTQTGTLNAGGMGVPTKTQLGANPEYSGLIADTITVYMWERTA